MIAARAAALAAALSAWAFGVTAEAGRFMFQVRPTRTAAFQRYAQMAARHGEFNRVMRHVSATITLPRDVPIIVEDCGEVNAFYRRSEQRISICYEYLDRVRTRIGTYGRRSDAENDARAMEAVTLVTLHEVGHALIHQLNLNVNYSREDAADDLAAYVAMRANAVLVAHRGAMSLRLARSSERGSNAHTDGPQRYLNIACLIYGSAPRRWGVMLQSGGGLVPDANAGRCQSEWARVERQWGGILARHRR